MRYRDPITRIIGEQGKSWVSIASVAGSVSAASLLSSSVVARVPMMRAMAESIRCAWVEEDIDDQPSYLDLPLHFAPIGDHQQLKYYAGGVVLTGSFVLLWDLVMLVCYKYFPKGSLHRRIESMLGTGSVLWQGYLVPNVTQATMLVCWHSGRGAAVFASGGIAAVLVGYSTYKWLRVLFAPQFSAQVSSNSIKSDAGQAQAVRAVLVEESFSEAWLRFLGPMVTGTVNPHRLLCRGVVAEEVLVGVLLSLLAGIRPEQDRSCRYTASCMLGVTALHVLYLLGIRPYRSRLDTAFANLNAILLVTQAILAVIITVTGATEGLLLTGFGFLGMALLILTVVQFVVDGLHSRIVRLKRRILQIHHDGVTIVSEANSSTGSDSGGSMKLRLTESSLRVLETPFLIASPERAVKTNPLAMRPSDNGIRIPEVPRLSRLPRRSTDPGRQVL